MSRPTKSPPRTPTAYCRLAARLAPLAAYRVWSFRPLAASATVELWSIHSHRIIIVHYDNGEFDYFLPGLHHKTHRAITDILAFSNNSG